MIPCLSCEIYGDDCKGETIPRCAVERAILVAYEMGFRDGKIGESQRQTEGDLLVIHDVGRIAGTWDVTPARPDGLAEFNVP